MRLDKCVLPLDCLVKYAAAFFRLLRSLLVQFGVADQVALGGVDLITDLDAVYTRDITLMFGSYTAIRYLAK